MLSDGYAHNQCDEESTSSDIEIISGGKPPEVRKGFGSHFGKNQSKMMEKQWHYFPHKFDFILVFAYHQNPPMKDSPMDKDEEEKVFCTTINNKNTIQI